MSAARLAVVVRCAAQGGKCGKVAGRLYEIPQPNGPPLLVLTDHHDQRMGEQVVPDSFEGTTDLVWCPKHRHVPDPTNGAASSQLRYRRGLDIIGTGPHVWDLCHLEEPYRRSQMKAKPEPAFWQPPAPPDGTPARPPKRPGGGASAPQA